MVRQIANGEKRPAQVCREHNLSEGCRCAGDESMHPCGEAAFMSKDLDWPDAAPSAYRRTGTLRGRLALENQFLKRGSPVLAPKETRHDPG